MPLNAEWHRAHPMPANPSMEERIAWHTEHAERCGCREIPLSIRKELARRDKAAAKS